TESMQQIDEMILELATRVGSRTAGEREVLRVRGERARVTAAVAGKPRRRVLLVFGLTPIVVAGPGSFPDEMLTLAGGQNVMTAAALGVSYPTIDLEQVIARDPEVLLDAAMFEHQMAEPLGPAWHSVRAVREGRVIS